MRNTTITFFLGKKEIPKEVADKMPILAAGGIAGAVDEVHAFDDESMFLNWAEKFTGGEKFLKLHRTLDAVREREKNPI